MAKAQNEEYTRFLGMFSHRDKQLFNELIRVSERFNRQVYSRLDEESKKAVETVQDMLHDFVFKVVENNLGGAQDSQTN